MERESIKINKDSIFLFFVRWRINEYERESLSKENQIKNRNEKQKKSTKNNTYVVFHRVACLGR